MQRTSEGCDIKAVREWHCPLYLTFIVQLSRWSWVLTSKILKSVKILLLWCPRGCCLPRELQPAMPQQRTPSNPDFHIPQQISLKMQTSIFISHSPYLSPTGPDSQYTDKPHVWTKVWTGFFQEMHTASQKLCHQLYQCPSSAHLFNRFSYFPNSPRQWTLQLHTVHR